MNADELLHIIRMGETSTVQFKERMDDAYKLGCELAAFSNSFGGQLLIGVNDKTGNLNGLSFDELQKMTTLLSNTASENVKPSILIKTQTVAGSRIVYAKHRNRRLQSFTNARLS